MKKISVVILGLMLLFSGCDNGFSGSDKLKIVASIYPIGDILQNLGGDEVEVKVLVEPGVSPHDYDPKPSDIGLVTDADLIFLIGGNFDSWAGQLVSDAGVPKEKVVMLKDFVSLRSYGDNSSELTVPEGTVVEGSNEGPLSENITPATVMTDNDFDPHFWLSPKRVIEMVDDISTKLKEMDPDNAALYDWEEEDFMTELDTLNSFIESEVAQFKTKKLVTFHDSFGYLANDYGLEIAGTIEELAGVEPTPEQLQKINDVIETNKLTVVFIEPQLSPDIVQALTIDLKVNIGELDPLGGVDGRVTYQALIRHNIIEMRTYMK